jgi:hypothetical protein
MGLSDMDCSNSAIQIFNDSFLRLRSHLDFTEQGDNNIGVRPSRADALLDTFDDLFNRTYVLEFLLMNPLVMHIM